MDVREYPVLYVDDESANRVVMKHNLGQFFTLRIADSAEAALEILASEPVAVLLADQRMPGVTGVDLAEQVLERYPDVVRVIITAYSDLDATIDAINRARVNRFIKKPWTREELVAVMEESVLAFHNGRLIKRLEERLRQLDRMTAVAVMSSAIAHDLRQPLAYIEPTLDVMKNEVRELAGEVAAERSRERLEVLTDCLGDVTQGVEKFKLITSTLMKSLSSKQVATERIDVREVLESAVAITRSTVRRHAQLQLELPGEPVSMMASEGRIIQLVVNLMLNAVQSLTEGTPMTNRIWVSLESDEESVVIRVRDTGCGISEEQLEQIFYPLYTTKGSSGGSGLGLPICKQIVEEMDGLIDVDSVVDRGSTFKVTLPRRQPEPEPDPQPDR
jgi:signal transduction histidine kinase